MTSGHTRDMARTTSTERRLGRPPHTDSLETRRRILDVARRQFAVHGYEVATNRRIAALVGVSTAAVYHYFPSKADLYVEVLADAEETVAARFRGVVTTASTLFESLAIVLDESHLMNSEDPSVAQLLAAFRIDERRHSDIAALVKGRTRPVAEFFAEIVDDAIRRGEVDVTSRRELLALITILLVGLSDAMSSDLRTHRLGVDAAKSLLAGRLPSSSVDAR